MHLLVLLAVLGSAPGEMKVARSLAEVPAAWRKQLPKDLDFSLEMLAFAAGLEQQPTATFSSRVRLEYEPSKGLSLIFEEPAPCPGQLGGQVGAHLAALGTVFRLPRARGAVHAVTVLTPPTGCEGARGLRLEDDVRRRPE